MQVNGLYGHIRHNDARSLALFAAFVFAFHLLALLGLAVPLGMLDQAHAPLTAPLGYVLRWMPIVTLAGAFLFGVQMLWHVYAVRLRTAFRFVDNSDEPRLCRIVEPLVIAAGLPIPYVAVIDTPMLNAFACGIRRRQAVLVFTRGLIDALDDEELGAVAAHEISHIANGDIRLIAAANVCLSSLLLIAPRTGSERDQLRLALIMPVLMLIMPLLFVLVIAIMALRKLALDGGRLTRLAIASSREFVADAQAIELTQNPAALVGALSRIDGRSTIPGLCAGQDAMMIDGPHDGTMATHPTINERVRAIVAVTGSMALSAPSRRDTRPVAGSFGRRGASERASVPSYPAPAPGSVWTGRGEELNRLGMTREVTVGALAGLAVFLGIHFSELDQPRALARAFSPAPLNALLAAAGRGAGCEVGGVSGMIGAHRLIPGGSRCDMGSFTQMLAEHRGEPNLVGLMAVMTHAFEPSNPAGAEGDGGGRECEQAGAALSDPDRECTRRDVRQAPIDAT